MITDIFMQFATGASRGMALNTIHYLRAIGNIYINLIVSWIWLIITVVLVVRTAIVLRKTPVADMTKFKTKLLAGWVFYIALYAVRRVINALWFESVIIPFIQENNILYGLINTTINEGIFALLIILVVSTVRYVFNIKKMKL